MNAVILLAEITYWYRPSEKGGNKFEGSAYSITFKKLGAKFGLSRGQAQEAASFLEDHGLITVKPISIDTMHGRMYNVPHFTPITDAIKEITYKLSGRHDEEIDPDSIPQNYDVDQATDEGVSGSSRGGSEVESHRSQGEADDAMPSGTVHPCPQVVTNTENYETNETHQDSSETDEIQADHMWAYAHNTHDSSAYQRPHPSGVSSSGSSSGKNVKKNPEPASRVARQPLDTPGSNWKGGPPDSDQYEDLNLPF
ncbi:MAG: hypothetical protein U0236_23070 [Nitrospira sp.]